MDWTENRETTMNSTQEHDQVRLCDITGATSDRRWNAWEFPRIRPSKDHIVLYQVSTGSTEKPPLPYKGEEDKWNDSYVRMPHSNSNRYDKECYWNWTKKTESRWTLIKKLLEKKISDSKALIGAILKYNGKFKDVWKFKALELYLNRHLNKKEKEDFFKYILPGIIKLALQLPDLIQAPIPLLKQNQCKSLSLSQAQIASLLANAFLCTFPWRNSTASNSAAAKLPKINFASLYEGTEDSVFQKLRCICNYFRRVISEIPTGVVTFSRRYVSPSDCPEWKSCSDPIKSVPVYVDSMCKIEDAKGLIQVDFANKFLGEGVLGSGLVQEEIRFLMCPELMASMIFTEPLEPKEALMIIGCERYNNYTGYGHDSFRWGGDHHDTTPLDSSRRRRCAVLAIDAEPYRNQYVQFEQSKIKRELNKAWIGFSFFGGNYNQLLYPGVATGNWGCGAYNGAPRLKCLIQIMAAAVARRPLAYYTFGDGYFKHEVETAYNLCRRHDVTVGELFRCISEYDKETDLRSFLEQNLQEKLTQYRRAYKKEFLRPENGEPLSQGNYFAESIGFDSNAGLSTDDCHPLNISKEHPQRRDKSTQGNYTPLTNFDSHNAGPSTKDDYHAQTASKEIHNQGRDHQNTTTNDAYHHPQNMPSRLQNLNRDDDYPQNTLKNDDSRHLSNDLDNFERRGGHSRKEWPSSNRGSLISQNKMNNNIQGGRPDILEREAHRGSSRFTRGYTPMRQPAISNNEVLKSTAQWAGLNSVGVYHALGNVSTRFTRGYSQTRQTTVSYREDLKLTAQWERQNLVGVYHALGNDEAFLPRMAAGTGSVDDASCKNVSAADTNPAENSERVVEEFKRST